MMSDLDPNQRPGAFSRLLCCLLTLAIALLPLSSARAQGSYAAGSCSLIPGSQTCIDATPCKTDSSGVSICLAGATVPSGGLSMNQTCWQYSYQYSCASQTVNTCASYQTNSNCSVSASTCVDTDPTTGKCTEFQYTYQCMTSPAQTTQQAVCTNGLFSAAAMPTPQVTNKTFTQAALAQEILREAQVYSNKGTQIFEGVKETCRKGYAGLQNCCKSSPGGKSNAMVSQTVFAAGASVVKYYGAQAVDWASSYVFDAMYNNGIFSEALMSTFGTGADTLGTSLATSGFSVGAFGFTAGTGAMPAGAFGANTSLVTFNGGGYIAFNPYVFAAYVVVMVIMSMMSCNSEEQLLAMHKGSDLSAYISTSCSSSFLGSCLGYTDTYCSFNSVLAKIINMQGKAQLGLNTADCQGLTIAQVSQIDFTKIDFTEFLGTLNNQALAGVPDTGKLTSNYQSALTGMTGGSAQTGVLATGSNVVGGTAPTTPPPANPNLPSYPHP